MTALSSIIICFIPYKILCIMKVQRCHHIYVDTPEYPEMLVLVSVLVLVLDNLRNRWASPRPPPVLQSVSRQCDAASPHRQHGHQPSTGGTRVNGKYLKDLIEVHRYVKKSNIQENSATWGFVEYYVDWIIVYLVIVTTLHKYKLLSCPRHPSHSPISFVSPCYVTLKIEML